MPLGKPRRRSSRRGSRYQKSPSKKPRKSRRSRRKSRTASPRRYRSGYNGPENDEEALQLALALSASLAEQHPTAPEGYKVERSAISRKGIESFRDNVTKYMMNYPHETYRQILRRMVNDGSTPKFVGNIGPTSDDISKYSLICLPNKLNLGQYTPIDKYADFISTIQKEINVQKFNHPTLVFRSVGSGVLEREVIRKLSWKGAVMFIDPHVSQEMADEVKHKQANSEYFRGESAYKKAYNHLKQKIPRQIPLVIASLNHGGEASVTSQMGMQENEFHELCLNRNERCRWIITWYNQMQLMCGSSPYQLVNVPLRTHLESRKPRYRVIQSKGDNNCLYHSIASCINKTHQEVKRDAMDYIRNNSKRFEALGDVEAYVEDRSREGAWGGDVEISALAMRYNMEIRVFMNHNGHLTEVGSARNATGTRTCNLLWSGVHYDRIEFFD